jgi:hypothetical protein
MYKQTIQQHYTAHMDTQYTSNWHYYSSFLLSSYTSSTFLGRPADPDPSCLIQLPSVVHTIPASMKYRTVLPPASYFPIPINDFFRRPFFNSQVRPVYTASFPLRGTQSSSFSFSAPRSSLPFSLLSLSLSLSIYLSIFISPHSPFCNLSSIKLTSMKGK